MGGLPCWSIARAAVAARTEVAPSRLHVYIEGCSESVAYYFVEAHQHLGHVCHSLGISATDLEETVSESGFYIHRALLEVTEREAISPTIATNQFKSL